VGVIPVGVVPVGVIPWALFPVGVIPGGRYSVLSININTAIVHHNPATGSQYTFSR
jgi:hypothetical protein